MNVEENLKILRAQDVAITPSLLENLDVIRDHLSKKVFTTPMYASRQFMCRLLWENMFLKHGAFNPKAEINWDDELSKMERDSTDAIKWADDMIDRVNVAIPKTTLIGIFFCFRQTFPEWSVPGDRELIYAYLKSGSITPIIQDMELRMRNSYL